MRIGMHLQPAISMRSMKFTMKMPYAIFPGERILGRSNLQALRSHHPGKPSGFTVRRMLGSGDLWITEYIITYEGRPAYTVSLMEFRNGKVVHETQYFADPFEAPACRSQWVRGLGENRTDASLL